MLFSQLLQRHDSCCQVAAAARTYLAQHTCFPSILCANKSPKPLWHEQNAFKTARSNQDVLEFICNLNIPQNGAGDHLSLQWSGPQRMLITSPHFDQTPAECRSTHASGSDSVTASHCAVRCCTAARRSYPIRQGEIPVYR